MCVGVFLRGSGARAGQRDEVKPLCFGIALGAASFGGDDQEVFTAGESVFLEQSFHAGSDSYAMIVSFPLVNLTHRHELPCAFCQFYTKS